MGLATDMFHDKRSGDRTYFATGQWWISLYICGKEPGTVRITCPGRIDKGNGNNRNKMLCYRLNTSVLPSPLMVNIAVPTCADDRIFRYAQCCAHLPNLVLVGKKNVSIGKDCSQLFFGIPEYILPGIK